MCDKHQYYKQQPENHLIGNKLADSSNILFSVQRYLSEYKSVYLDSFDLQILNEYLKNDGIFKKQ